MHTFPKSGRARRKSRKDSFKAKIVPEAPVKTAPPAPVKPDVLPKTTVRATKSKSVKMSR